MVRLFFAGGGAGIESSVLIALVVLAGVPWAGGAGTGVAVGTGVVTGAGMGDADTGAAEAWAGEGTGGC